MLGGSQMNISKIEVLNILSRNKNKWLPTRKVASLLNIVTSEGINRVSNILYRLRHYPMIERKRNSHSYQYRFCGNKMRHPTKIKRVTKTKVKKSGVDDYTFIEPLPESCEGFCEFCECFTEISFQTEKAGCSIVHLCKRHGEAANNDLCDYGTYFVSPKKPKPAPVEEALL